MKPVDSISVPYPMSWVDEERDCSSWLGNVLQQEAFRTINEIGARVRLSQTRRIRQDWYYLQSSDHFYYMSTKFFSDGEVHSYFNPYNTPYEAFINYMNVLSDFIIRIDDAMTTSGKKVEDGSSTSSATDVKKDAGKKKKSRKVASTGSATSKKAAEAKKSTKTKTTKQVKNK